ncbi:hypothetical protein G7Y89_g9593 [Cudoniella acicularis]|uniref:Uncharacterized protein n=1 Tax=Cudoniella acicularis TaxID=354080 RepID=A0A8H4W1R1_9HELO|nr:hypothetical protein G7Y89_g9593 [Cudoniella acicularis]
MVLRVRILVRPNRLISVFEFGMCFIQLHAYSTPVHHLFCSAPAPASSTPLALAINTNYTSKCVPWSPTPVFLRTIALTELRDASQKTASIQSRSRHPMRSRNNNGKRSSGAAWEKVQDDSVERLFGGPRAGEEQGAF